MAWTADVVSAAGSDSPRTAGGGPGLIQVGMSSPTPAAPRSSPALAYLMLCLVMLCWAGNAIVGRAVRAEVGPFTLAFVRWSGALLLIAPLGARHLAGDLPALRAHWRTVLLLGLVGVAAFNALLYSGLRHTTATNGLLLQALIPPGVLLFAALLAPRGRRGAPPRGQVPGVLLSTLGVAVIVFRGDLGALAALRFGLGDGLVLCAVLAWSLYTALLPRRPAVHPLSFLSVSFAIGALAMAPPAAAEWISGRGVAWNADVAGAFAYVAVFPSAIAYFLYNRAVSVLGPGPAGQTISLLPVFGAGLASAMLHEPLRGWHLAGIALILAGLAVTALGARRRPEPAATMAR